MTTKKIKASGVNDDASISRMKIDITLTFQDLTSDERDLKVKAIQDSVYELLNEHYYHSEIKIQ